VPTFILEIMMHTIAYLAANLDIEIPGSGVKPNRCGHVLISNIGPLDMDMGLAPLCSPTFAMLVICFGKLVKKPVWDKATESIVAKDMMSGVFTFDHRFGDAALSSQMVRII